MRVELTPQEERAYNAFYRHFCDHGVPPTYLEWKDQLGVARSTLSGYFQGLIQKGVMEKSKGNYTTRSVRGDKLLHTITSDTIQQLEGVFSPPPFDEGDVLEVVRGTVPPPQVPYVLVWRVITEWHEVWNKSVLPDLCFTEYRYIGYISSMYRPFVRRP